MIEVPTDCRMIGGDQTADDVFTRSKVTPGGGGLTDVVRAQTRVSDVGDDEQKREDQGTAEQTHLPLVRGLEEELARCLLLSRRVLQP